MRRVLNKWLYKKGYEIQKIGKTPHLLEQLINKKGPLTFLQIGANDGISFDNLYPIVTKYRCKGVVVEPLPDMFERLSLNFKHHKQIKPVRMAVHPTATAAEIYRVSKNRLDQYDDWCSGIASFNKDHLLKHNIQEEDIEAEIVPCQPLMSLIAEQELVSIDYLQVDTEGFDHEILKMLDLESIKPSIIKFEKVHTPATEFKNIREKLEAHGYRIIDDTRDAIAVLES